MAKGEELIGNWEINKFYYSGDVVVIFQGVDPKTKK